MRLREDAERRGESSSREQGDDEVAAERWPPGHGRSKQGWRGARIGGTMATTTTTDGQRGKEGLQHDGGGRRCYEGDKE